MLASIKSKLLVPAAISLFLVGCGSTSNSQSTAPQMTLETVSMTPEWYLAQGNTAPTAITRQQYQLLAAKAYIANQAYSFADQILIGISGQLVSDPHTRAEYLYLKARVLQAQQQHSAAVNLLDYPSQWRLPNWQWQAYYALRAQLFQALSMPMQEAEQLIALSQYVSPQERLQFNDFIWSALSKVDAQTLNQAGQTNPSQLNQGWLQLAFIAQYYSASQQQLLASLAQWQQQYAGHPASIQLPAGLDSALNSQPYQPQQIAVLLPLTGNSAQIAAPIRQGILSQYYAQSYTQNYAQNNSQSNLASDGLGNGVSATEPQITVNFYDTSTGVVEAYQQAVAQGASFVIGPLLPKNVESLIAYQQNPDVNAKILPQLFLNQPAVVPTSADRYFFALSPSQEAGNAARYLAEQQVQKPLILANEDTVSRRMAGAFQQEWYSLTNKEVEVYYYQKDKVGETTKQALGVLDSQARIRRMKQLISSKLEADFRSRDDVDAIYMIGDSTQISLLKPFIDVSLSVSAEPIPLYAPSRARAEVVNAETANDLAGVAMSDIPLLLNYPIDLANTKSLFPQWKNAQHRLYAMGYDALGLVGALSQMKNFADYRYAGYTGELSLTPQGVIRLQPAWGRYQQGQFSSFELKF